MNESLIRAIAEIEKDAIRFAVKIAMDDFANGTCKIDIQEIYVHEVWLKYQEHKLAILTGSFEERMTEGVIRVDKANRENS